MHIFIISILILFISCSSNKKNFKPDEAKPTWLAGPSKFAPRDNDGMERIHPFFDLVPYASSKDNTINFVMTTPKDSDRVYDIDLSSGHLFTDKLLCEQDDVWDSYSGTVFKAPFSMGFVPRLLDNLGNPQKIIVFGGKESFVPFSTEPKFSQRVRVIGAVYYEYCEEYPCLQSDSWKTSILLVAINPNDSSFSDVRRITQLKRLVNWPKAKAFLENYKGRFFSVEKDYPSYRVAGEMNAFDAFKRIFKHGHYFQFEEMKKMLLSCYKLYDWLGGSGKLLLDKEYKEKSIEEIRKEIYGGVRFRDTGELTKKIYKDFASFFKYFYKNFSDEYLTCQRFVNPISHKHDVTQLMFLRYLSGFLFMEDLGLAYTCSNKAWGRNGTSFGGRSAVNLKKSKNRCITSQLNFSFKGIAPYMVGLKSRQRTHYRFIAYDYGSKGTNKPIFNWVKSQGKSLRCLNVNPEIKAFRNKDIISDDLKWIDFPTYTEGSVSVIEAQVIK